MLKYSSSKICRQLLSFRGNFGKFKWSEFQNECFYNILTKRCVHANTTSGFVVLPPEMPPDTAMDNVYLRHDQLQDFSQSTPDKLVRALAKLSQIYDIELYKNTKNLSLNKINTFSTVFDEMEKMYAPLRSIYNVSNQLYHLSNVYDDACDRCMELYQRLSNETLSDVNLYKAILKIHRSDAHHLTKEQAFICSTFINRMEIMGPKLTNFNKEALQSVCNRYAKHYFNFKSVLRLSMKQFSYLHSSYSDLKEMPLEQLMYMSLDKKQVKKGPWNVTLERNSVYPFLKYCSSQKARYFVWNSLVNVASIKHNRFKLTNHNRIVKIMKERESMTRLLGFDNFTEMFLHETNFKTVSQVEKFVNGLKSVVKPLVDDDYAEVCKFAQISGCEHTIEAWDVEYWRTRYRNEKIFNTDKTSFNQTCYSNYFKYNTILKNTWKILSDLFDLKVVDSTTDVSPWDQNVKIVSIYKEKKLLGHIFIDPLAPYNINETRDVKGRVQSKFHENITSTAYINIYNNPPASGELKWDECFKIDGMVSFFQQLGSALEHICLNSQYSLINFQKRPISNISSTVFKQIFTQPTLLSKILQDSSTGDYITLPICTKIHNGIYAMSSLDFIYNLMISAMDLEINGRWSHWHDSCQALWKHFMPVSLDKDDKRGCSLDAIYNERSAGRLFQSQLMENYAYNISNKMIKNCSNDADFIALMRRYYKTVMERKEAFTTHESVANFLKTEPDSTAVFDHFNCYTLKKLIE